MNKIYLALLLITGIAQGQALTYTPPPQAAYITTDGLNFTAWTSAAGYGGLTFTPPAIGLYCQASAGAAWTPCVPGGGGGGGGASFPATNGLVYNTSTTASTTATSAQVQSAATNVITSKGYATIELAVAACGGTYPCQINLNSPLTQSTSTTYTLPNGVYIKGEAGGLLTRTSGQTLTSNNPSQWFDGPPVNFGLSSGTVTNLQGQADVEWFGAIGDGILSSSSGTDNTIAIQATINSLKSGWAFLQPGYYRTTAALSIRKSAVGIHGASQGYSYPTGATPVSVILSTSTSADILDVAGTGPASGMLFWNTFKDFSVQRSVVPSGTAVGISINYVGGYVIDHVQSEDSVTDFYFHSAPKFGVGKISNSTAGWGFSGFTNYSSFGGNLYGWWLDSADGNAQNTIVFDNIATGNNSTGATTYGLYDVGQAINDQDFEMFDISSTTYGMYFNATGNATNYSSSDIIIHKGTIDNFSNTGIYVAGLGNANKANLVITDGYIFSYFCGGSDLSANNTSGVTLETSELVCSGGTSVSMTNSTNTMIRNNRIFASSIGISQTAGAAGNLITGNYINGDVTTPLSNSGQTDTFSINSNVFSQTTSPNESYFAGIVVGNQGISGVNTYYNGISWVNSVAAPTESLRFADQNLQSDYPNQNIGGGLNECPSQAAGTIAGMETSCVALTFFPGINNGATPIHHFIFNALSNQPYFAGTNIGKDTVVSVNQPNTPDSLAVTQISTTVATDKGLVVQGFASQTADLTDWESSTGAVLASMLKDGTQFMQLNEQAIGTPIVSASTIAPIKGITHITGTAAIATITPPSGMSSTIGGSITLIADGAWTTTTAGNIYAAMTSTAGTSYTATYDGNKWYIK
jgi:hypothetical protein